MNRTMNKSYEQNDDLEESSFQKKEETRKNKKIKTREAGKEEGLESAHKCVLP